MLFLVLLVQCSAHLWLVPLQRHGELVDFHVTVHSIRMHHKQSSVVCVMNSVLLDDALVSKQIQRHVDGLVLVRPRDPRIRLSAVDLLQYSVDAIIAGEIPRGVKHPFAYIVWATPPWIALQQLAWPPLYLGVVPPARVLASRFSDDFAIFSRTFDRALLGDLSHIDSLAALIPRNTTRLNSSLCAPVSDLRQNEAAWIERQGKMCTFGRPNAPRVLCGISGLMYDSENFKPSMWWTYFVVPLNGEWHWVAKDIPVVLYPWFFSLVLALHFVFAGVVLWLAVWAFRAQDRWMKHAEPLLARIRRFSGPRIQDVRFVVRTSIFAAGFLVTSLFPPLFRPVVGLLALLLWLAALIGLVLDSVYMPCVLASCVEGDLELHGSPYISRETHLFLEGKRDPDLALARARARFWTQHIAAVGGGFLVLGLLITLLLVFNVSVVTMAVVGAAGISFIIGFTIERAFAATWSNMEYGLILSERKKEQ